MQFLELVLKVLNTHFSMPRKRDWTLKVNFEDPRQMKVLGSWLKFSCRGRIAQQLNEGKVNDHQVFGSTLVLFGLEGSANSGWIRCSSHKHCCDNKFYGRNHNTRGEWVGRETAHSDFDYPWGYTRFGLMPHCAKVFDLSSAKGVSLFPLDKFDGAAAAVLIRGELQKSVFWLVGWFFFLVIVQTALEIKCVSSEHLKLIRVLSPSTCSLFLILQVCKLNRRMVLQLAVVYLACMCATIIPEMKETYRHPWQQNFFPGGPHRHARRGPGGVSGTRDSPGGLLGASLHISVPRMPRTTWIIAFLASKVLRWQRGGTSLRHHVTGRYRRRESTPISTCRRYSGAFLLSTCLSISSSSYTGKKADTTSPEAGAWFSSPSSVWTPGWLRSEARWVGAPFWFELRVQYLFIYLFIEARERSPGARDCR